MMVRDGILLINAKTGLIEDGNPSLLKMLGAAKRGLLKKKAWEVGFLDGPLASKAAFARLVRGGSASFEHLRVKTGRGRRLDVAAEGTVFRIDGAHVVQFSLHDITERLRLASALQEQEERYRKIFDNSRLGIAIIGLDLRITSVNQAFSRITGYDEADLKHLTLADITHPGHLAGDLKIMRAARRCTNEDFHVEKRYIGKRGDVIWANTHISAVCDGAGRPMYFQTIVEDITERKQVEAALAEQNLRVVEKEKAIQRLKDEFVFIAAHELRTPVTAISWSMELLRECQKKNNVRDPESTEILDILGENTKKLGGLVSELLEVSRMEYGTFKIVPERFGLSAAIERAVAGVRQLAGEKKVDVKVAAPPVGLADAFADPIRLQEVMTNLLTNAIKYNHAGGNVTVRITEGDAEVHVSVEDNGLGLSAEDIQKLFHRFSRVASAATGKVTGTGLGLFIVRQIVERMGGRVWAESAGRGRGSVFTFSLPKAK